MQKKVFSVKSSDFEKEISHFDETRRKSLLEQIKNLEDKEMGLPITKPVHGNVLSSMKCNKIFSLKMPNSDRALAVIMEQDGNKIFAWFWTGPHEAYNKKVADIRALKNAEKREPIKAEPKIVEKLEEFKLETKTVMLQNVQDMKQMHLGTNSHGSKNSHGNKNSKRIKG